MIIMLAATMMTTGTAMVQVDSRGVGSKDSGIDTAAIMTMIMD